MKFANLPHQQQVNISKRVAQLRLNVSRNRYAVANLKQRLVHAEYEAEKNEKELQKMLASFEDSGNI